jgi:uncharacterized protein (DUF736 family)
MTKWVYKIINKKMIQNFSIFKAKEKKNEKSPDYNISINVGTKEQPRYVNIGGGWIKEFSGGKFISCSFSKPFGDTKEYGITEVKNPNEPNFDTDSRGKSNGDEEVNLDDIGF